MKFVKFCNQGIKPMLSCNISFKVVPLGLTNQAYAFYNHFNSTSSNVLLLPTSTISNGALRLNIVLASVPIQSSYMFAITI